jgi:hypothetical protein
LNSPKVNEAVLDNIEVMFETEFILKQKAQLKYLESKSKKMKSRGFILNSFSHEFLWTATPAYYVSSFMLFILLKNRYNLRIAHSLPFMALPPTGDYIKRDYYIKKFPEDNKTFYKSKQVVD